MKERDDELDTLLSALEVEGPTELERARLRRVLAKSSRPAAAWNPKSIAIGLVAGLAIGVLATRFLLARESAGENFADDATIVHVYAKAD